MRVALLKGQSQYGVLRDFVDEVAAGFIARGWDAKILDFVETYDATTGLERAFAAAGPLDLVFSVNAFGDARTPDGRYITDLTGAPHVLQYVDYPLNFVERFSKLSPNLAVLVVDRSHIRLIDTVFGKERFAYLGFGPHGGMGEVASMPATAAEWIAARPVPVFFAGTNYRPDKSQWPSLPDEVQYMFDAAIDMSLSREWVSPSEAVDAVMKSCGVDPDDPALDKLMRDTVREIRQLTVLVQEFVRCERRQRFLSAARKIGLPLTVAGKNWDGVAGVDNRGPLEIGDCLGLMRRSRLAFSLSGNFGDGSHERPLSAMLAGTAVACDRTGFYESAFVPGRDLFLFRWLSLESDLAAIAALLDEPEKLFAMAQSGQRAVASGHRWDHRVDDIIAAGRAAARKRGLNGALAA